MKARPLYRSLTFWSGIFVMGFIAWAGCFSMARYLTVNWGRNRLAIEHGYLTWTTNPSYSPMDLRHHIARIPADNVGQFSYFDRPVLLHGLDSDRNSLKYFVGEWASFTDDMNEGAMLQAPLGAWMLILPLWCVLLATAVVWCGLILWRDRRIRRAERLGLTGG